LTKPEPALVTILLTREHSRLSSQVKTLEKLLHTPHSDKEHQRLIKLAVKRGVVAWLADRFRRR
jgi:hypothetical protein